MKIKEDQPTFRAYEEAAQLLGVEIRALMAVAAVESGFEGAFNEDGTPVVLFERHVFHRLTGGRFDDALLTPFPSGRLSDKSPGGYGPRSLQHRKLFAACELDRDAALKSCSWGLFQIMGENYARAGFSTLQEFVNAMWRSADAQLRALAVFLRHDERLVLALREKDWKAFARVYNGPGFARSGYDVRIAAAYKGEVV